MKKKEFIPSYTVNIDEIETLDDIAPVWAISKHNAGLPLTDEELADICIDVCTNCVKDMTPAVHIVTIECNCENKKKLPWYKRLWNWIRRK